jgi:hypothetical protein
MFAALLIYAVFSLPMLEKAAPPHLLVGVEAICLWAFGVSWLVKGEVLLSDEKVPSDLAPSPGGAALT